jgi:hypothetical protein
MNIEANKTYVGVVEDNNDPKKMGRVKARVMQVFENIPVEEIPWAFPWKDLNGNQFNVPDKGKVVMVVFDNGDKNAPEYIYADHYNINLEKKLESLSESDYTSMKSLLFDHRTQIYVNESEGLKIDHKYNNINLTENTIDLNLKDNNRNLNLGDATADQQAILGNHWLDWFDEFVDNLLGSQAGPFLGNLGAPVIPNPAFISCLLKYKSLRDPVFLSHHVNIVDNNKVSTVGFAKREDDPLIGDVWQSTITENTLTEKTNEDFKPVEGPKSDGSADSTTGPTSSDSLTSPTNTTSTPDSSGAVNTIGSPTASVNTPTISNINATASANFVDINSGTPSFGTPQSGQIPTQNESANQTPSTPQSEPLSSIKSNPTIEKLVKFLQSKKYEVYDQPNILNLVAMRTKDDGRVTNKFDDKLYVFFRKDNNNWQLLEYDISTVPGPRPEGYHNPRGPMGSLTGVSGAPIMAYAQYIDKLKLDTYIREFKQFRDNSGRTIPDTVVKIKALKFSDTIIYRNDLSDKYNYRRTPERVVSDKSKKYSFDYTGEFWIRIAQLLPSSPPTIDRLFLSGDGSQVFKSKPQFNQFMQLCEDHNKIKNTFTYTICRKSEFDDFIPTS